MSILLLSRAQHTQLIHKDIPWPHLRTLTLLLSMRERASKPYTQHLLLILMSLTAPPHSPKKQKEKRNAKESASLHTFHPTTCLIIRTQAHPFPSPFPLLHTFLLQVLVIQEQRHDLAGLGCVHADAVPMSMPRALADHHGLDLKKQRRNWVKNQSTQCTLLCSGTRSLNGDSTKGTPDQQIGGWRGL